MSGDDGNGHKSKKRAVVGEEVEVLPASAPSIIAGTFLGGHLLHISLLIFVAASKKRGTHVGQRR